MLRIADSLISEDELINDLKDLLETFSKHRDGYEKASMATDDNELQRVLKKISDYKKISVLEIKTALKHYSEKIDFDSTISKRNLSKDLSSFFNSCDNKFIIEACLIKESSLKNKLDLMLNKNYKALKIKMLLENYGSQCIAIKSWLWEQSLRF